MAEPKHFKRRCNCSKETDVHCHRVSVVQQVRGRAKLHHIVCQRLKEGKRSDGTENAANPKGIPHGLADTEALGDRQVRRVGRYPADQYSVDYKVCTVQCLTPVDVRGDHCAYSELPSHRLDDTACRLKTSSIDVMKSYHDRSKLGVLQNVPD